MQVKKQQLEVDMKQWSGSKLGKEYIKAVYCYPAYLTFRQSNPGMTESQAGIKISRRNINNLKYADDTTLMAESDEELKSLLIRVIEESEKAGLKLNIQKNETMASGPITSWQIEGEKMEALTDFISLGSKITAEVTAAMKLKDACSLEGKL